MCWVVAMSISKGRGSRRKKPLPAWSSTYSSSTSVSILISFTLITSGFILITPTLIAAAIAQEGNTTKGAAAITEASSSPQPDLNFSEFPEFDEEFSQSEDLSSFFSSFMTEVNGTYMNPNIGFQINLPAGWKGIEFNFEINSVFAVPGEANLDLLTGGGGGEDVQEPAAFMTILGIDQEGFNWLESISQVPALGGAGDGGGQAGSIGGQEEGATLPQGNSDPFGITTTPSGDSTISCTFSQPSFVTINSINAEERLGECIDEAGGSNAKTKSYAFATQDNSLIVVGFYSNSTSTYDQNLPLFEESVKTISISRQADIATSEIYNRYKELVEVQQQLLLSNQTDATTAADPNATTATEEEGGEETTTASTERSPADPNQQSSLDQHDDLASITIIDRAGPLPEVENEHAEQ